ncbi:membrane metalloprotease ARASP, chloroplastic-like [Quillaja saponaria]|uniref:Membrane metalloprotease ARASP, chloroplastic-like n=1 Tax=Quillaja saponaria TaxID=32244 RepID=A0AAD7L081_QUISA|nr:membrane metalloprotease ARASP, chloroplastic-like [Quillaja saponaria]
MKLSNPTFHAVHPPHISSKHIHLLHRSLISIARAVFYTSRVDIHLETGLILGHGLFLDLILGISRVLQSVLEAAAVLTAIIVVHESGHFLAAYLQGIHVSKFAVGFGPILAKFNSNNVEYSIRAFPLGGFVGFPDNDPQSDIPVDDENLLKNRPILDRVIVISAGVIANIIFAYTIIFVQVLSVGLPVQEAFPGVIVPDVRPFSAASRDGLLAGDVILEVNGSELPKPGFNAVSEIVDVVKKNPSKYVLLKVKRGQEDFELRVTPDENYDGTGKIGVQLSPNVKLSKVRPNNFMEVISYTGKEFWGLTFSVLDSLKQTVLNFSQTASKVSGPVAIIAVGAEVARSNVDGLYQFAAVLNLNLAVINLLPLPALDGGSLALILVEAARGGRKLPLEVEQGIMSSGITLVIFLGLFLIVRDTLNLDFIKDLL